MFQELPPAEPRRWGKRRTRSMFRNWHNAGRGVGHLAAVAGLLTIVAGLVLLSSLFVGWYEFRYAGVAPPTDGPNAAYFGGSSTFFPGSTFQSSASCSGNPQFCSSGNRNHTTDYPYDNNGTVVDAYPTTGKVYGFLQVDLLVAGLLALGAGALMLRAAASPGVGRRMTTILLLGALGLALAAPMAVWIGTPLATHVDYVADAHGQATNFTGPGGSFWGACDVPSCGSGGGVADSWGPITGWYAGWGAVALLVGAALIHAVAKRPQRNREAPHPSLGTPTNPTGDPTNGPSTMTGSLGGRLDRPSTPSRHSASGSGSQGPGRTLDEQTGSGWRDASDDHQRPGSALHEVAGQLALCEWGRCST